MNILTLFLCIDQMPDRTAGTLLIKKLPLSRLPIDLFSHKKSFSTWACAFQAHNWQRRNDIQVNCRCAAVTLRTATKPNGRRLIQQLRPQWRPATLPVYCFQHYVSTYPLQNSGPCNSVNYLGHSKNVSWWWWWWWWWCNASKKTTV